MKHIPRLQFKSKQKIFTRCVPHNVTYNHRFLNYSISCKDQATTKKKKKFYQENISYAYDSWLNKNSLIQVHLRGIRSRLGRR